MINFVVAMPAEAKPLIEHYRLSFERKQYGFSVYRQRETALVTSGLGKVNAAAATTYLQAINGRDASDLWINLGVAGHADLQIGTVVLAATVCDHATGRVWSIPAPDGNGCENHPVLTLDKPDFDYGFDAVIEMEASGFVATARRFSTPAKVQCYKVIADNATDAGRKLDPAAASALIVTSLPVLDEVVKRLLQHEGECHAG